MYLGTTSGGWIESLVLDRGQLFAFQFNSYSAAIDNLSNGTRHLLRGYGALGGGALDANGYLYVMAWGEGHRPTSFNILKINPNDLKVTSTTHTGVRATSIDNAEMQALPGGGLLAFIAETPSNQQDNPMSDYLWRVTLSGIERRKLPANIGLDMHAFANGVYLFGGPAKNVVARLTLSTKYFTRVVSTMTTPAGTQLFALT
jgi:hypothetical protein